MGYGFADRLIPLLSSSAGKIARHEIPDWCQTPTLPYSHPIGPATTLDVGCYPAPAGAVAGAPGSELLPPKRQTVVDRLKRRLEVYRRHQGSCLPRYDQAANGLYDAQRQETLLLKQKFLEAKAKKTRRNDHHGRNAAGGDQGQRNNVNQAKLKRQASSPLLDCAIDNGTDGHPTKIQRTGASNDTFCKSANPQQQQPNQQSGMPSFSVQIVQQFSSNTSQSHSQTIQTNVTVQALSNNSIKTSGSPIASNAVSSISSPGCAGAGTSANDSFNQLPNSASNNSGAISSSSISVGTNVECKQEPDTNFAQCSANGSHHLPELNSELTSANNNGNTTTSSTAATTGDRFSDSLANLGFPEDSNDDVIHPDILKDIIDDVFTNPSDFYQSMNGFNFVDNLGIKENQDNSDEKDSIKPIMSLNKSIQNSPSNSFQNSARSPSIFTMSQSQQSVFDFQTGVNSNNTSQTVPNNSSNVTQNYQSSRLGSYTATSPNLPAINNNGLGLDFKLTEPSPAAQTLKQMAEQHQSMQQKQQQLGLGIGANHPRSSFGSDSFPDPLSNIRTNFLNGSPTSVQKSPTSLFQPMGFSQQNFTAASGSTIKQEVGTPNTPLYQSNVNQHLPDIELHKRRQVLQMQQNQIGAITRPSFSHSPDQKRSYQGMRSAPHYNATSPGNPSNESNARNSPVPPHPGQFMRGVSTPGVTPPPQGFGSSPSPSTGSTLHMTQSQMSGNNPQIQMSQSQHLIMNQDKKASIISQQQNLQARGFYTGQNSLHMSQSQSVSFQFPNVVMRGRNPIANQRTNLASHQNSVQRHIKHQYMNKPPPDYQTSMDPKNCNAMQSSPLYQNNPMQINMSDSININNDQNDRSVDQRNSVPLSLSQSYTKISPSESTSRPYPGTVSFYELSLAPDIFSSENSLPTSRLCPTQLHSSSNPSSRRLYGGLSAGDLISRPCSGQSPSSDNSNVERSYPSVIPISEITPKSPSTNNSNAMRQFPGIMPITEVISKSYANESSSNNNSNGMRSYSGTIPITEAIIASCPTESPSNNNTSVMRPYPGTAPNSEAIIVSCANESASNSNSHGMRSFPGIGPITEVVSRSRANESPSNNNSSGMRPYPGTIPNTDAIIASGPNKSPSNSNSNGLKSFSEEINDVIPIQDETSSNNNANSERSFSSIPLTDLMPRNSSDVINSNKSVSDSSDRAFPGVIALHKMPHSSRTYSDLISIQEALPVNRGCSNSASVSNMNPTSQSYPSVAFQLSTSISGPYSSMSTVSAISGQIYSQAMLTNPTVTASATTNKGRSKQVGSQATNKLCNSVRQQKPPNVNVGPEGLNISQKPPIMARDCRQTYVHQNQHQTTSNTNENAIAAYSRNGTLEYGNSRNSNINNFQSGLMNSNLPGDNPSLISISQSNNHAQMQPNVNLHDRTNQLTNQPQTVTSNDSTFQNSQIQISDVSTSDMNQSPSPFLNIEPDSFELDLMRGTRDIFTDEELYNASMNFDVGQFVMDFFDK